MGLKVGRGSGALRTAGGVAHRVVSAPSGEQVVSLDVDTRVIGRTARVLLAAGATLGLVLAFAIGAGIGLGEGIAAGVGSLAAFGAAAVTTAKTWAGRIRKGMRRALEAITHPTVAGVHDTIAGRVAKTIDALRDLGREVRRRR